MRVLRAAIVCVTLAGAGRALPAHAQSENVIREGLWRGWLQEADQDSIRITMSIRRSDRHILMTLQGRSGVTYDMDGARLKDDVLTYDWPLGLGSFLYCRMTRRDGKSFEGTCNDRSPGETGKGLRVWMIIEPPDSAQSLTSHPDDSS